MFRLTAFFHLVIPVAIVAVIAYFVIRKAVKDAILDAKKDRMFNNENM